jgi:hypothetical protein
MSITRFGYANGYANDGIYNYLLIMAQILWNHTWVYMINQWKNNETKKIIQSDEP